MRRVKRLVSDEDGSELVEFALASTIFFMLLFGVIEFCLVLYAGGFVAYAAQQGARYAMVRGGDWTGTCTSINSYACKTTTALVTSYVTSIPHPGLGATNVTVTPTWLTTTAIGGACTQYAQGCQVQVKVSYTFKLQIYKFTGSIPVGSTSIETIQD